jgi:predicted secreted protein
VQVLHFQALRPGATTVTLQYRRPWDPGNRALQTYTLNVDVLREWRY